LLLSKIWLQSRKWWQSGSLVPFSVPFSVFVVARLFNVPSPQQPQRKETSASNSFKHYLGTKLHFSPGHLSILEAIPVAIELGWSSNSGISSTQFHRTENWTAGWRLGGQDN
jgi:hypothetical protein